MLGLSGSRIARLSEIHHRQGKVYFCLLSNHHHHGHHHWVLEMRWYSLSHRLLGLPSPFPPLSPLPSPFPMVLSRTIGRPSNNSIDQWWTVLVDQILGKNLMTYFQTLFVSFRIYWLTQIFAQWRTLCDVIVMNPHVSLGLLWRSHLGMPSPHFAMWLLWEPPPRVTIVIVMALPLPSSGPPLTQKSIQTWSQR